jgi:anti-anti-sigma factor
VSEAQTEYELEDTSLIINIRKNGKDVVLELSGSLTVGEDMAVLRDSIRNEFAKGVTDFVLDFTGVAHIDSRGLGELVSTSVEITKKGGSLKLIGVSSRSNQVIEMTRLVTVFKSSAMEQELKKRRLATIIVILVTSLLSGLIVYILSK